MQVRNQSFITDHADPVKSAQKDRAAAKKEANKTAKNGVNDIAAKMADKRAAAAKEAKAKNQKRLEQTRAAQKEAKAKLQAHLEEMRDARQAEAKERLEQALAQKDGGAHDATHGTKNAPGNRFDALA